MGLRSQRPYTSTLHLSPSPHPHPQPTHSSCVKRGLSVFAGQACSAPGTVLRHRRAPSVLGAEAGEGGLDCLVAWRDEGAASKSGHRGLELRESCVAAP